MVRSVVVRLLVALGVLAGPAAVDGQPPGRVARVGLLAGGGAGPAPGGFAPLRDRLAELGWVEGRNVHLEFRFAEARLDRLPALAAELVRLNVDVLVASTPPSVRAAQRATATLPIVMTAVVDPVGAGFVASLGRPGGNITGVSSAVPEGYFGKVLQLFKEARPGATRVAMLFNAGNPLNYVATQGADLAAGAAALNLKVEYLEVRRVEDFEPAFEVAARAAVDGVFPVGDPLIFLHRQRIHELAARHRLPTFHPTREYLGDRGLFSYGPSLAGGMRQAAEYVDRILRGARPAALPVQQPSKYELIVNLRAARALGVTIPQTLLVSADEVLQ
jgi:putative ABC transport system substrate-binding protein